MATVRRVEVYVLGDSVPCARTDMTTDEVQALVDLLRCPDEVVELYDAASKRQVIVPARSVANVFVHDKEGD